MVSIGLYDQIEQLLLEGSASSHVWDEISSILKENVQFDRMVIASTDVPRGLFSPFLIAGVSVPDWDANPVHRMADSLIGESVKSSTPILSDRIISVYTKHSEGDLVGVPNNYWSSTLGMRIVNGGEIVGAIVFLSHEPNLYRPDKISIIERISRILGPYLSQQFLQKEILRATEHQSNLEYLLQQFNNSQDPSTFFNTFYSVFAARTTLVHGALYAYDRYSDKYVPVASVDSLGDSEHIVLDRGTQLVNEHRLSGESVHLACQHKSVPASNVGTSLMELVRQSPGFKELCLIPLTAGTNRVGALLLAMSDCNPSMLERVRDIESAGPIASAFLQLHQTSRQWDRQQHISSVLQYAVENLCDAPSSAQKLGVFEDTLTRAIGASEFSIEIRHRITGISHYRYSYPQNSSPNTTAAPDSESITVNSRLGDTHIIDVSASFKSGLAGLSASHELRAVVRVCAVILGTAIVAESDISNGLPTQRAALDSAEIQASSFGLTRRESEILKYLTQGATNDEIATRCGLAEGTVKNRLVSIYKKLGVRNRSQASLKALGAGPSN
jgi:DNA-binding CsgD family transcriptional regulator